MGGTGSDRRAVLSGMAGVVAFGGAAHALAIQPVGGEAAMKPTLVFDVTETIVDLSALTPVFERIFSDPTSLRSWFDNLIVYSEALTLTGTYADAGKVGVAVLEMMAKIRGKTVRPDDLALLKRISAAMPAYADVASGLRRLRAAGHRLVTLSNSPNAGVETQLKAAGIRDAFDQLFSIDTSIHCYKPAPETYHEVASALGATPSDLWLVSCHGFDVLGAASAGWHTAMILRAGNAPFGIGPQPDIVVADIEALATAMAQRS